MLCSPNFRKNTLSDISTLTPEHFSPVPERKEDFTWENEQQEQQKNRSTTTINKKCRENTNVLYHLL